MPEISLALWALAQATNTPVPPAKTVYFPSDYATPSVSCTGPWTRTIPIISDFEAGWYGRQLAAAQEPSLYQAARTNRPNLGMTLRFTWLRTFHPPVIVRVEGLGTASPRLVAKQLTGAGGYDPGKLGKQVERPLSPGEARDFAAVVRRTDPLHLPPKSCDDGDDGAEWLVEGIDGKGYHFVGRWSPKKGAIRDLGLAMLALTGWTFTPIY